MTPEALVEQHIIKRLLLTPNESIDYLLIPNYKEACLNHGFSVNEQTDDFGYYWEETEDPDDRDYFNTEKEAWINCAKANRIEPEYLQPLQDIEVTQWLYEKLLKKVQPVDQYKNAYIWGRPTSNAAIKEDDVIITIARESTVE